MAEKKKKPPRLTVKQYFMALPFSVAMLVVPLLPTVLLMFLRRAGRAPIAVVLLALLTFGYPWLRHRKPRIAWWVGTIAAVASVIGVVIATVVMGIFFRYWVIITYALAVGFVVLNRERWKPWTFGVFGLLLLYHIIPLGAVQVIMALVGMALVGLFFLLPDRDNFPLPPVVVTMIMALLLAHGGGFYFDVGGDAEIAQHAAGGEVFRFTGQRRGWARVLGGNPRFLAPTCRGDLFYVGTKKGSRSALMVINPASPKFRKVAMKVPLRGGITENMVIDCRSQTLVIGNSGSGEVYILNMRDPRTVVAKEQLEGARLNLLRLDRGRNRLFVGASNKSFLYVLRASNLSEFDRVELADPVSDMTVDRTGGHAVLVVSEDGTVTRTAANERGNFEVRATGEVDVGKLIYNLALDETGRRLFVSSLFGREIVVLDADTLATIGSFRTSRGTRYMHFDARRNLLYAGNFFFGQLDAFAVATDGTAEKAWSMEVGRRVRYLMMDPIRDRLCFTSQMGGYCLDLNTLKPAAEPTPEIAAPDVESDTPDAAEPADDDTPPATDDTPTATDDTPTDGTPAATPPPVDDSAK
ncbi:MAG: hypothetical protein P9L99_07740 [Candidatus Lernaella stagnicola]|nr:hypothetical protein [Candidatus Lernaella stagnicola]